jgi:hypothetical protein
METSLTNFKTQFGDALLAFLWRQWSALGVSGHARTADAWLIDPEALLLFSTVVARRDARLFDEVLDWLQLNADRLNLQRLARLQREHALGDATVLAAMAAQLTLAKAHPKWRTVAARNAPPASIAAARPLFPHLPVIGRGDETWLAWGWQRPPVELRGLSQAPRPDQPATFLFKLRALFGLQTRAEVIAWLLAHETGHPAEIARATGYFRGSIQSVLNELAASGHVFALRAGREKRFGLRHDEWRFLLTWPAAKEFPNWVPWDAVFGLFQRVNDLLEHPLLAAMTDSVQAIELDRAVTPAAVLFPAGLWPTIPSGLVGEAALAANVERLRHLLNHLQPA